MKIYFVKTKLTLNNKLSFQFLIENRSAETFKIKKIYIKYYNPIRHTIDLIKMHSSHDIIKAREFKEIYLWKAPLIEQQEVRRDEGILFGWFHTVIIKFQYGKTIKKIFLTNLNEEYVDKYNDTFIVKWKKRIFYLYFKLNRLFYLYINYKFLKSRIRYWHWKIRNYWLIKKRRKS